MRLDAVTRELARQQHGVLTRAQLTNDGMSRPAITRAIAAGQLQAIHRGVFLLGGAPQTRRARLWTAVLATEGIVGFATAAELWGLTEPTDDRVHIAIPHRRRVDIPSGVRVHRVPTAPHARRRLEGLPVCSRSWAALDHLGALRGGAASAFFDRALQKGWITPEDVTGRLRDWRGRTGNTQLRRFASTMGDGAAAESERLLHRILRSGGLRGWVPNYELLSPAGDVIAVLDVAFPDQRLAVEVDGMAFHSDAIRFRDDRNRQNRVVLLGWTVLRFTWADLVERPGYVLATIRRCLTA